MSTQTDLFATRATAVSPSEVEQLVRVLSGKGWRKAKALAQELQMDDRTIREVANQSKGRVISGQRGYALVDEVTTEEANHSANWLEHQAKKMLRRAAEIRQAMHRRWDCEDWADENVGAMRG